MQPAQKVTAPTSDSFEFTVQPDNGYKLSKVTLTVSGADRELKADANGLYTVDAADVAQSPRVTLETEQEKAAEPAKEATPIEETEDVDSVDDETDDAAAVASEENVSVASDVSVKPGETAKAKVGDTVTLEGTGNTGQGLIFWSDCGYPHEWKATGENKNDANVTGNGSNASVSFKSAGKYTIEHKYCKKWHKENKDHNTDKETFTVVVSDNGVTSLTISGESSVKQFKTIQLTTNAPNVTWSSSDEKVATVDQQGNVKGIAQGKVTVKAQTLGTNGELLTATKEITVTAAPETGVQNAYFFFLKPGMKPKSNSAADWYPESGAETDNNRGRINITDIQTDGSEAGNSYDNVANRVVSWPDGLIEESASANGFVLSRKSEYWNTLFEAYESKTGITNQNDVKEIILRPYKISHPATGYHLDCTVEVVAKSKVTAEFYVWYPGKEGYQMIDTGIYTLDGDSASVPETKEELKETIEYNGVTYKLYSWYDNPIISGEPVSFPATASSNVKYYAKYVAQDKTVTVKYVDKDANKVLDSEIVTGLVKGQEVTRDPKEIKGYEVDEGSKNPKTAIAGTDPEIVFYYNAKKGEAGYHLSVPGATWSGGTPSDLVSPWDGNSLKYKYNYGFARGDTFNVTSAVPVAKDKVFIGWLDKARDGRPSTICHADDSITYIYSKDQTYCLDALWASLSATGENVTYDGQPHGVTVDAAINDGSTLPDKYKQQAKEHVTLGNIEYSVDGGENWTATAPTFVNAGKYSVSVRANVKVDGKETKQLTTETEVVISKREVTLKSASGEWTYNGEERTKHEMEFVNGFVEGEGATINYTGAITNVGETENTFTYELNEGTNANNYTFAEPEYGTLKVNPVSDKVTVTITGNKGTKPYNGKEQSVSGYEFKANNKLYTDGDFKFTGNATAKGTAAGTYTMGLAKENFANISKNFASVEFVVEDGQLEITGGEIDQKGVKWTLNNLQKKYDGNTYKAGTATAKDKFGNSLKVEYSVDGKKWTGDPSTITAKNYNDSKFIQLRATGDNYKDGEYAYSSEPEQLIIGKRLLTMTSAGDSKKYDGTPLLKNSQSDVAVTGDGFAEGEGATYDITGSQTEAGSSKNEFTYSLNDGTLPENYQITCELGTLTVIANDSEVVVAIKGNSATKTYTGQPQSVEGYKVVSISNDKYSSNDFELKGSAKAERSGEGTTYMGLSENSFVNKSANFSNVTFQVTDGYITIKPKSIVPDPKDPDNSMSVKVPANVVYNGQAQQQKPVVKDGEKTLVEGTDYRLTYSEDATNVGTVTVTVTGMGNYTGEAKVSYQITPAPLSITTDSDTKVYDGTPLTARGSIEGLVADETVDFKVTGSQTLAGSSKNTYELRWNGSAKESNYEIKKSDIGTLSVTAQSINPEDPSSYKGVTVGDLKNIKYNGKDRKQEPIVKSDGVGLVKGRDYELSYSKDTVNAGEVTVTVKGIGSYSGTATRTYEITKLKVKLISKTRSKVYDGSALTDSTVVETGKDTFVSGEVSNIRATGSITNPGTVENSITFDKGEKFNENNYVIEYACGELTVTPKNVAAKGMKVQAPSDTVYNGKKQEFEPIVTDGSKKLVKGVDYNLSFSDDAVNAGTVTITVAGKGNYGGTASVQYKIKKRPVTLVSNGHTRNYNGSPLEDDAVVVTSEYNFVDGEVSDLKANGSITEPGEVVNSITYTKNASYKDSNYKVTITEGKLKVLPRNLISSGMEISNLVDVVYNGRVQKQKPVVKDGDKTLVEGTDYTLSYSEDATNVGKVTVTVTGKGNYTGTVERTYNITRAPLTVVTESATHVYDGHELTAPGKLEGLVAGETADFKTTGKQKSVGSSLNTYDINWNGTAKSGNYRIAAKKLGTLTITESEQTIVVATTGGRFEYDGLTHVPTVNVYNLPEGYSVRDASSNAAVKDVNARKDSDQGIAVTADNLVILNAEGEDVTSKLKIEKADGHLAVTPRTVTVNTPSDSKVYDGTALTAEGSISNLAEGETVDFKTTGSQTKVGESTNTYELTWNGSAKESNYTVKETLGKLEVSKQSIDEKDKKDYKGIKIDDPASTIYDGSEHQWTPTVADADGNKLTVDKDYEVVYKREGVVSDDFKNAGTITVVISGKGNYSGTVTKKYEINKRAVTLTSADHTWTYDGKDHKEKHVSVTCDGFAADEGVDYSDFATVKDVTTKPVENTFTYTAKKGTDLEKNYNVKVVNGKLTVTKAAATGNIVLTTKDESKTYDGHALEAGEAKATATTGDDIKVEYSADHKTWTENRSEVALTNAGSKTVYVRASSEKNFSGFVEATETLTVDPATLTIATKNAEKPYDGKELTADGSMTGLVNGETAEFKVTGSLTDVGEIANAYTLTWNGTAKKSNYIIKETVGRLKVTARSIDDTTYGMSVSKPESVEYDGNAHKWAPTVKDGEKTLAEGTDYTVAYGKDDFTNVTGEIKVTVTGMGNYAGSVERAYQITPAPLTVETKGATKVYDGEALTHDAATIKGLKNNETATIHAPGSQTEVGESDNGYAITWDGSAQKDNYTIKTKTIGKLVVSETADQITATPVNVETTYDGNAHGTTVQVTGLPKGYTVKKAESKATATNVADGEVKATVDELVIVNAQGKDVTSKLNIKRGTATIKVNPAPLTVTTDGGEREYDGTALTANGIKVEGLKGEDSVSAKTTGSRTKVGSSNNTYEINWKDTKKSNYKVTDVLGTLKVTPSTKAVTLTSGSASHDYSGHALTSDEIKAEGLPEGFTVKAEMDGAQTDAGSSENTVKSYKILDAKGDDVTDMFANVTVKTGTLTVSPKKITVETEGATKVYDGQELTNENGAIHGLVSGEHADVVTNGTQTNVGSSDNGYTVAWGTAKEGNYTIASDTLGKLIVTPQSVNPNDPSYHKLQVSNPADLTYDGQTHKWAPEVKDFTGTELREGVDYALAYDTDDFINAGSITVTVVGKGNYTGTVSRTYRIKPAPVSIKTESAARVYNGKALTAGGAITGLVNGETVDFRVTGSQTKVGHSANTYKLAWTGTAREANYTIDSVETGMLTVTESEDTVVVTTTGGIFTYDGKAHGATVTVSQLPEGYTVDGTPSSDATATDANGDGVKATVDHLVIRNAEGEDVTSKLDIKKVDGTIKVLPAELKVTTDSATKVYDGTALTAGATVTGLVGDEEATLEATGKQTQVGSSSNGYKLTFDKTAKDKNYKVVSENLGTLTVTKQSIVPSEPGTPSDNYKGVTVDDPKDAAYDGIEHKWTPIVKDSEGKTLVEGTDYVVSYDTDDFIDVATINVTITGKGNYAGTIAKSYRITKAPLHVVTGSATKVYDGQALTSATVTIDGLAKRDRIGIAVTGSQANVGSSQNTYTIDWMQTSADNYELTDELGTLTVAAAPARPTTPSTPTVPNPTPSSSDGDSTTTTAAPKSDDSATGSDQEQKEEKIFDAKNPLGKFDGKKDTCWVHWYMIVCAVATAAYGLFVGLRRDKHGRRLQNDLDKVLGDDETQE
ncbi:MAG: Ig-like domain-containing protein [Collinsella sp.]|nr:Ig-like domain-containing protein [Collinsella sp.]